MQRADLQAKLDIVMEEEEALMAELVQTAAAECSDPEPPQKCEEIPGRAGITSSSLASLFAAGETHVEDWLEQRSGCMAYGVWGIRYGVWSMGYGVWGMHLFIAW